MRPRLLRLLGPGAVFALVSAAVWVLHGQLAEFSFRSLAASFAAIPAASLGQATALTLANYAVLMGYDLLALRAAGRPLALGRIAAASFVGTAYSNSLGLSMLAGSSARFRLYSSWGLSALDIVKVVAFTTTTLWLGLCGAAGAALLWTESLPPALPLSGGLGTRALGGLLLAVPAAWVAAAALRRRPLRLGGAEFSLPRPGLAALQAATGGLDWVLAAAVLFVLLRTLAPIPFGHFLAVFLLAQLAGLVSQVPGGLGVFESVSLLLLSGTAPAGDLMAVLAAYRAVYYLLPLALATLLLGVHEVLAAREHLGRLARRSLRWVGPLAPQFLAGGAFLAGVVLLASGATPAEGQRLYWLRGFLPLAVLEVSHFLGSVTGLLLLVVAQGLRRRLDATYYLAAGLLGVGIAASLLKGFDYEEALLLCLVLGALLPARRQFYRHSSLLAESFSPRWAVSVALALLCTTWLGFFAFRHVEYSQELWWRFTFQSNAARFLRAEVGVMVTLLALAAARLLSPARRRPAPARGTDLEAVAPLVAAAPRASAHLALLGDKSFLFSDSGRSFLMYATEGRSFVAMGDPVGPAEEQAELAWRFRELSDAAGGWPVFYQTCKDTLPLYLDLGLAILKIGEQAYVPLAEFTLDGKQRKGFRNVRNRIEAEGWEFAVLPPAEVRPRLAELEAVSASWLAAKRTREKGFSLGRFAPDYLSRFPLAVVRRNEGIAAFANLWAAGRREELSVDLMRHGPDAPADAMEYLLFMLMLWGRDQGYGRFDLGMAPLSGMAGRPLATAWSRVGNLLFTYGEYFYNFKGLRRYKEKFAPLWEPRYLVCPGGLALPRVLANLASLVSGGIKGTVAK